MEFGWGVVGIGQQARENMIPAIAAAEGAKLTGLCSTDPEKAKQLSEDYTADVYDSLDEMLAADNVDIVYIATPNFLHVPQAAQSIAAGKHVFIEAPHALSVDGANKLTEKARRADLKLGIGLHLRHHPLHISIKERVDRRELGDTKLIEAQYFMDIDWPDNWWKDDLRAGPASLMALGIHALDLVTWIKGEKVDEVMAMGPSSKSSLNTMLTVVLHFKDGSQGLVTCSSESGFAANRIAVTGNRGRIQADCALARGPFQTNLQGCYVDGEKTDEFDSVNPYQAQVEQFCKAIAQDTEFSPGGNDGRDLVESTCAIIESMKSRRSVKVGEIQRLIGGT